MDVSARLAAVDADAVSSPEQDPSNELTATSSKFSPAFRSAGLFHTTLIPAGKSKRHNSARINSDASRSSPRADPAYKARVRVCAFAQTEKHAASSKTLKVNDMVTS